MYAIGTELGVKELFYTHVGTYLGNGRVFHNHWKNGVEIVSLHEFSNGKKIVVRTSGVDDVPAFYNRAGRALANPHPYNFLNNNCEHAASLAREGVESSPQLAVYGVLGLFAGTFLLIRGAKS